MRIRPIALWGVLIATGLSPTRAGEPGADSAYRDAVLPLVSSHCVRCHGEAKPKGGINLAGFASAADAKKDRKTWEKVREAIDSGTMPPADKPQPDRAAVDKVVAWIESEFSKADCRLQDHPGRVTLRRLNRSEYRNTVRDLVGVDYEPTEDFPSDDVGYGFDNIGDVLTLPPILMERYLAAAEAIANRAIVDDNPPKPRVKNLTLGKDAGDGEVVRRNLRRLASNGQAGLSYEFPSDGDYALRIQAFGEQAGPEPVKIGFLVDGNTIHQAEVKATVKNMERVLDPEWGHYEAKFHVERGKHRLDVAFLNDFYDDKLPEGVARDRNLILRSNFWEVVGPIPVDKGRLPESHKRIIFRKPRGLQDTDTIRELVTRFATRAYRRPVTSDEVGRLMRFFELARLDGDRFEVGMRLAVQAVLVSPHFLFRVELDREAPGASHALNDYELATRLSYFLWSSLPDDHLRELANRGQLHEPKNLEAEVRRMLADPKSRALVDNFASQWLQIRRLRDVKPDPAQFPGFDESLRDAMRRETEMFFEAVMREDRSVLDFLDGDFTYLNEKLARHYGIEGVKGDEFRRVDHPGDRRGGLLTQASILTVTSNPTRTSPVKRGKWVLEQLLGTPPPPPPPDIPELKDDKDASKGGSLRQRLEQHRSSASCATCHAKMDPLGFGLENFDPVGAWREKDGPFPIDASGVLPGGRSFEGPKALKAILRGKSKEFTRCLAEKMLIYATGRGLEDPDLCAIDRITDGLAADGHKFSRLILEVVLSDPFRKRQTQGATK